MVDVYQAATSPPRKAAAARQDQSLDIPLRLKPSPPISPQYQSQVHSQSSCTASAHLDNFWFERSRHIHITQHVSDPQINEQAYTDASPRSTSFTAASIPLPDPSIHTSWSFHPILQFSVVIFLMQYYPRLYGTTILFIRFTLFIIWLSTVLLTTTASTGICVLLLVFMSIIVCHFLHLSDRLILRHCMREFDCAYLLLQIIIYICMGTWSLSHHDPAYVVVFITIPAITMLLALFHDASIRVPNGTKLFHHITILCSIMYLFIRRFSTSTSKSGTVDLFFAHPICLVVCTDSEHLMYMSFVPLFLYAIKNMRITINNIRRPHLQLTYLLRIPVSCQVAPDPDGPSSSSSPTPSTTQSTYPEASPSIVLSPSANLSDVDFGRLAAHSIVARYPMAGRSLIMRTCTERSILTSATNNRTYVFPFQPLLPYNPYTQVIFKAANSSWYFPFVIVAPLLCIILPALVVYIYPSMNSTTQAILSSVGSVVIIALAVCECTRSDRSCIHAVVTRFEFMFSCVAIIQWIIFASYAQPQILIMNMGIAYVVVSFGTLLFDSVHGIGRTRHFKRLILLLIVVSNITSLIRAQLTTRTTFGDVQVCINHYCTLASVIINAAIQTMLIFQLKYLGLITLYPSQCVLMSLQVALKYQQPRGQVVMHIAPLTSASSLASPTSNFNLSSNPSSDVVDRSCAFLDYGSPRHQTETRILSSQSDHLSLDIPVHVHIPHHTTRASSNSFFTTSSVTSEASLLPHA